MQFEMARPNSFGDMIGATREEGGEGYARISLVLEEKHTNPNGVVHGGVLCTLMDEACGWAVMTVRGMEAMIEAPHVTVDMNVSFLSGARPGDRLVVEGRALRVGRTVAFAEAEVRRGEETLIAKGRFTFVVQSRRGG
jgi:acyl-CoA thioesterase